MKFINDIKIQAIKLNKTNFFVVIDFDRTITSKYSCDTWDASGKLLGEKYKKNLNELFQKYFPIENDYMISYEQKYNAMEDWYYKCMKLFFDYNLTIDKLNKSIEVSNLIFRDGAKEFLINMYKNKIPVIILSAGIGNVIEKFLRNNDCYFDNIMIISNFIFFDEKGNIVEKNEKLIHTLNKKIGNSKIDESILKRQYRLLLGDLIEDKNMIPIEEWDKTISIRLFK